MNAKELIIDWIHLKRLEWDLQEVIEVHKSTQ